MTELLDAQEVGAAPPEWVRDELGGATGNGIRVAVLDSGWDRSIEDGRVLPGVGFVDPDDDFALARNDDDQDVLGHGTACVGVILEVAPDARVVPVKVFGNKLETSPGTLEAALHWAIEAGVQVINVSLGTRLEGTLRNLYMACERARQAGIIIVAAGHNANDWSYPAIFENVIGVSAGRFESPYHFRYRTEHAHECEGWGVERPVLWIGGERVVRHGTSFAAPGITGIVCLILERYPDARLEDVREMLARFALPGGDQALMEFELPEIKPAKRRTRKKAAEPAPAETKAKGRKPASSKSAATPSAEAPRRRKAAAAPAKSAEKAAASRPAKAPAKASSPRKRAASTTAAPPSTADAKPRKRTPSAAKAADPAPPARPAARSRKAAAAPATADTNSRKRASTSAKAAEKSPAKSAKSAKPAAAPTKSAPARAEPNARKRASSSKAADQPAPAKASAKAPKRVASPAEATPAKRTTASAKAADTAAPKSRKRTAAAATSPVADAQPRKRAAAKPKAADEGKAAKASGAGAEPKGRKRTART